MALPGITWNLCRLVYFIQIYNVSTEMKAEFVPRQKVGRVLFLCHALCEGTSSQNLFPYLEHGHQEVFVRVYDASSRIGTCIEHTQGTETREFTMLFPLRLKNDILTEDITPSATDRV